MPGLASLSKSLVTRLGERRSQLAIYELGDDDKVLGAYAFAFQYFPETITDTKAVNYQARDIPGASLPMYQWISSGERLISFTAVFTSDIDLSQDGGAFAKLISKGLVRRNLDVRTALLWLRRFMLPSYGEVQSIGVPLTLAPRKLYLSATNAGLNLQGGISAQGSDNLGGALSGPSVPAAFRDLVLCVMTQCDITYEAFFVSGLPRVATVQLQFAQIAQRAGFVDFPRRNAALDAVVRGGDSSSAIYKYPLKIKYQ